MLAGAASGQCIACCLDPAVGWLLRLARAIFQKPADDQSQHVIAEMRILKIELFSFGFAEFEQPAIRSTRDARSAPMLRSKDTDLADDRAGMNDLADFGNLKLSFRQIVEPVCQVAGPKHGFAGGEPARAHER